MNKELLEQELIKFEDSFNRRFGFGVWDSRAANGHRDEGISSTSVLEHAEKAIQSAYLQGRTDERSDIIKVIKNRRDMYEPAYEVPDKAIVWGLDEIAKEIKALSQK